MQSPLHGCPYDFQRWSANNIRIEFQKAGFTVENLVLPRGIVAVIAELFYKHALKSSSSCYRRTVRKLINLFLPVIVFLDGHLQQTNRMTTGFLMAARKG